MSIEDGEESRRGLSMILKEKVALPVVLDKDRLRRRLAVAMDGAALKKAVGRLIPDDLQLGPQRRALHANFVDALRNLPSSLRCEGRGGLGRASR